MYLWRAHSRAAMFHTLHKIQRDTRLCTYLVYCATFYPFPVTVDTDLGVLHFNPTTLILQTILIHLFRRRHCLRPMAPLRNVFGKYEEEAGGVLGGWYRSYISCMQASCRKNRRIELHVLLLKTFLLPLHPLWIGVGQNNKKTLNTHIHTWM